MVQQQYFDSIDDLPEPQPFPQAAQQIMAACESPDVDANQLTSIIQLDPAVSIRLLRAANSSMYGFSGEIRSINHAIVALGLRSVKELAISFAAAALFESGNNVNARMRLWQHSLAVGCIASAIAPFANVKASEAFLAGVVHDVGKLMLFDVLDGDYFELTAGSCSDTIISIENERFGVNHQELGGRCAEQWGLPLEINSAIENHHEPEAADFSPELAAVVCVANSYSQIWKLTNYRDQAAESEAAKRCDVQLEESDVEEIRTTAIEHVKTMLAVCE